MLTGQDWHAWQVLAGSSVHSLKTTKLYLVHSQVAQHEPVMPSWQHQIHFVVQDGVYLAVLVYVLS